MNGEYCENCKILEGRLNEIMREYKKLIRNDGGELMKLQKESKERYEEHLVICRKFGDYRTWMKGEWDKLIKENRDLHKRILEITKMAKKDLDSMRKKINDLQKTTPSDRP